MMSTKVSSRLKAVVGVGIVTLWAAGSPAQQTDDPTLLREAVARQAAPASDEARAAELAGKADGLVANHQPNQAISLYEQAAKLDPTNKAIQMQLLRAKRATGRLSHIDRQRLGLLEVEVAVNFELLRNKLRLRIIEARRALLAGDKATAAAAASQAEALLDQFPAGVNPQTYRRQLARIRRDLSGARQGAKPRAPADRPRQKDRPVQRPPAAVTAPTRPEGRYQPAPPIIDVDQLLEQDKDYYRYQRDLDDLFRRRQAAAIGDVRESMVLPDDVVTYPPDWAEKTRQRAKYRGGVLYRGPVVKGKDGQERYTAIYDVSDLTSEIPNFTSSTVLNLHDATRDFFDREALRRYSRIFSSGGTADDLARGLPLLQYFDGVDTSATAGGYSQREADLLMDTIDQFLAQ